jgi:hypothetical protein
MKDIGKIDDTQNERQKTPSPTHKATLTPTKQHPLKDLQKAKPKPSEYLDDSEECEEDDDDEQVITTVEHTENDENKNIITDNTPDYTPEESTNMNINPNQIFIEIDNQLPNHTDRMNEADVMENDENLMEDETKVDTSGKIVKKKKNANNNSLNVKNNNNRGGNLTMSKSQNKLNDSMNTSTDKIEGK